MCISSDKRYIMYHPKSFTCLTITVFSVKILIKRSLSPILYVQRGMGLWSDKPYSRTFIDLNDIWKWDVLRLWSGLKGRISLYNFIFASLDQSNFYAGLKEFKIMIIWPVTLSIPLLEACVWAHATNSTKKGP